MSSKKVKELLKQMSTKEKVRQLLQINADFVKRDIGTSATGVSGNMNLTTEDVFGVGSVLNIGGAQNALEVRQKYLANSQNKIPLLLMEDVIHGFKTIFPIPLAMACSFNMEIAEKCAEIAATEAAFNGVDVVFSPMINLCRDARWGRVMEAYGEDPFLNGEFGKACIRGYHKGGVACCVKHFAAYGAAESGRDYNTTDVSEHTLREYYLKAFRECLKENPEMIMTSFNMLNGLPVNADKHLLVDILRKEWRYNGVVISDYGAVLEMINHSFVETERECAEICANNRVDIEMMTASYLHNLPSLVEEGKVSQKTIDEMVERVLTLKEKLNLFEKPLGKTDVKKAKEYCLCEENRRLAKNAAKETFVLLENNGILPLRTGQKVALVGPLAAEKNILGAWACAGRATDAVSVLEGVKKLLGRKVPYSKGCELDLFSTDESNIEQAVQTAKQADVAIVCVGEHSYSSGESASRSNITLPAVQVQLVRRLKQNNIPVVVVLFTGRPLALTELKPLADAILCVWQPGTEGGNAIAETLFGSNPSGKLVSSFPRSVGQCPVYYNHFSTGRPKQNDDFGGPKYSSCFIDQYNSPLYPFGYGLSYTQFSYGVPKISALEMHRGETLTISVDVTNCGDLFGKETVQLYLRDKFGSCVRPVKELKAFCKLSLQPQETQTATFTLTEDMLKFYRADGTYGAESGEFDVFVGADSAVEAFTTFHFCNHD